MVTFIETDDNAELVKRIPEELPILPLRNTVAFPFSALPLVVGIPRSVKLVQDAREGNRLIGLLTAKDPSIEEPGPGQIYETGTVAKVYHMVKAPNDTLQVVVQGLERFRVEHWLGTEPYLRARITLVPDVVDLDVELDALQRTLRDLAQEVIALSPNLSEEAGNFLNQVQDPRYLAYLVAANARLEISKAQEILEKESIKEKLRALISHLSHEKEVLTLGQKIQTEAREEMDKSWVKQMKRSLRMLSIRRR
jgi:ATP-dependent Lon protease